MSTRTQKTIPFFLVAMLTLTAIVTSFMLQPTLRPQQTNTVSTVRALDHQDQSIQFRQTTIEKHRPAALVDHDQANRNFTLSIPQQSAAEPFVLYPELQQIRLLENMPSTQAIYGLEPMLSNKDPVVRLAAIEALGDISIPPVLPILTTALDDPDTQLRIALMGALVFQDDESIAGSIETYLYDQQRDVRMAAIEGLADLEVESSVHTLAGLLADQDSQIRNHAISALGEIGGKNAIGYLKQAQFDPDLIIRRNAVAILSDLEY